MNIKNSKTVADNTWLNRPWPAIDKHLKEKYNIIAVIDLVELDSNPQRLYQLLQQAYKEFYQHNDRIVIYHYDTDFYHSNGAGFAINNLITCLHSLDISINFCILLTNHYGISTEIATLSNSNPGMSIFENNYYLAQTTPEPAPIDINIHKIKKLYICLNGARRTHRVLFLSYLKEYQLLNRGILSWHFDSLPMVNDRATSNINIESLSMPTFLTTIPFTRVNDRFYIDSVGREIYSRNHGFFLNSWKDPTIIGESNQNRWDISAVQEAFLYVSVETVLQYPYPYLTEKTFRAILHKRPFVIVGAPGSIAQIQKLGFKTFHTVWSEEYDSIIDPNLRMRSIIEIIQKIGSLSSDQLKDLMYSIQDVIEFNYNFYVKEFSDNILKHRLNTL